MSPSPEVYKMNGLKLEVIITADTANDLGDALQALIDSIGQGNKERKSATDEWFYDYKITGKEVTQ